MNEIWQTTQELIAKGLGEIIAVSITVVLAAIKRKIDLKRMHKNRYKSKYVKMYDER